MSAFKEQIGGDHYKGLVVPLAEFCHLNGIGTLEGNVIYYVTRWRSKGGLEDVKKARHTLDMLIEMEEKLAAAKREEVLHSGSRFSEKSP